MVSTRSRTVECDPAIIQETLRDDRFIDTRGLGIPRKIIVEMREFSGTAPDLLEEEQRFIVRLRRAFCYRGGIHPSCGCAFVAVARERSFTEIKSQGENRA